MSGTTDPLLVHVHVPKTAGQSLMNMLWNSFGERVIHIDYATDPAGTGPAVAPDLDFVGEQLAAHPDAQAITSHCFRFEHPAVLAGRRALYTTFLRDPWEQSKSWIRYIKARATTFPVATRTFLQLPDGVEDWPLTDIAQHLIDGSSGPADRRAGGFWFLPGRFFGCDGDPDALIRLLERFFLVGVFEEFDRSLQTLRSRLVPVGLDLDIVGRPHLNPSPREGGAGSLELYAPLRDFLDQRAAADRAAFDWARRRLA